MIFTEDGSLSCYPNIFALGKGVIEHDRCHDWPNTTDRYRSGINRAG